MLVVSIKLGTLRYRTAYAPLLLQILLSHFKFYSGRYQENSSRSQFILFGNIMSRGGQRSNRFIVKNTRIQVAVFWVVTPSSNVVGYQRFEGPRCLHFWVVSPCIYMVGYQRLEGPRCLQIRWAQPRIRRLESSSPSIQIFEKCRNCH